MTLDKIEATCEGSEKVTFHRHSMEVPEFSHRAIFHPLGFPTELRTNSAEILSQARDLWSIFRNRWSTKPIRVDVHILEGAADECPATPVIRIMYPLLINIADTGNYCIVDLERGTTQIVLTRSTMRYRSYLDYFFLAPAPLGHIATRFTTPVHAACVALNGVGVLLCGDSGAGKSSLAYACARAGWTYLTDDSSYLLNDERERVVTGNCHQVRFRPAAAKLFPELTGLEITPPAAGKPSIELPTAMMEGITCASTAKVDFVVFLNRMMPDPPELARYDKDVARLSMRQVLFGSEESRGVQYGALERLLTAEVLELRYSDLDWAVQRLELLALEGR